MSGHHSLQSVLRQAAAPDLPAELAVELAHRPEWPLLQVLASRPTLPAAALDVLAQRPEVSVRALAAAHPGLPRKWFTQLSSDTEASVQLTLAQRSDLPEHCLRHLIRPGTSLRVRAAVARHPHTSADVLQHLLNLEPRLHRTLALRPDLPPTFMEALAQRGDAEVRRVLVQRTDLSGETLIRLCHAPEVEVRLLLAQSALPNEQSLRVLMADPDPLVQRAALQHPQAPVSALVALARAGDPEPAQWARQHPHFPASEEARLRQLETLHLEQDSEFHQLEAQLLRDHQSRATAQGQELEAEAERVHAGLRAQLEAEHQERLRALHHNIERRLEREAQSLQARIQDRQRGAEESLRPWRLEAAAVEEQARQDAQQRHDQTLRQLIEDARFTENQFREKWMAGHRLEGEREHEETLRQLDKKAQIQHGHVLEELKRALAAERPQALQTLQFELTQTFQTQLAEAQTRHAEQRQLARQALLDAHQSALMADRQQLQTQHDALLAQTTEQALVEGRQRHEKELQLLQGRLEREREEAQQALSQQHEEALLAAQTRQTVTFAGEQATLRADPVQSQTAEPLPRPQPARGQTSHLETLQRQALRRPLPEPPDEIMPLLSALWKARRLSQYDLDGLVGRSGGRPVRRAFERYADVLATAGSPLLMRDLRGEVPAWYLNTEVLQAVFN